MAVLPQLYMIPSGAIALAAAQRTVIPVTIENFYDFIWLDGFFSSDQAAVQAGTDAVFSGYLINVLPSAGQEKMFANQVPIAHAFGMHGINYGARRLPFPGRFAGGSTVNLDITNLDAANPHNLRITFAGVRIPMGSVWPIPGLDMMARPA